jgi:hypothetical protein
VGGELQVLSKQSANVIEYPVLCLSQGIFDLARNEEELTICTRSALKTDYFKKMLIVDSRGIGRRVTGATKLRGVGVLWGYNFLLQQRIRVKLECSDEPFQVEVGELRARVLKALKQWWTGLPNFPEVLRRVKDAESVREVIGVVEGLHHRNILLSKTWFFGT